MTLLVIFAFSIRDRYSIFTANCIGIFIVLYSASAFLPSFQPNSTMMNSGWGGGGGAAGVVPGN